MRAPSLFLLLAAAQSVLTGCAARPAPNPPAVGQPMRVMSLNQCTDQLLLMLLPPERIASVTWLSRDPRYSAQVAAATKVAVNHGSVEEVAAAHPDLIVSDTFSNPAGRGLIERLHLPLLTLDDAYDSAAIRKNVHMLAAALGVKTRGEALIARMDAQLIPAAPRSICVAVWGRDGMAESPLTATVIRAAGLRDVTPATGPADIEALLRASPDFLIEGGSSDGGTSLGDMKRDYPLVLHRWPASRILRVPARDTICGTPAIGAAAAALRAQVRAAADTPT